MKEFGFEDDSLFLLGMAFDITRGPGKSNNTKAFDCLNEQFIASKVLLFKEPLEALDKCQNSSCYNDVKIEMDLTVDEILEQTKICLIDAESNVEFYNKFENMIEKSDFLLKSCIENLIKKMESKPDEVHPLLSQILWIVRQIEDGKNFNELMDIVNNREIMNFAKEISKE